MNLAGKQMALVWMASYYFEESRLNQWTEPKAQRLELNNEKFQP